MNAKFFGIVLLSFFSLSSLQAQDCGKTLQLYAQSAKIQDYKSAKPYYDKLIKNCPDSSLAIYQYGQRMFKHFLQIAEKNKNKEKQIKYAKARIKNNNLRLKYYPKETDKQRILAENAQIKYDYDLAPKPEIFRMFNKAWNYDNDGFSNPKPLYTYFRLVIELYNNDQKELDDIFNLYEEINDKIKIEKIEQAEVKKPLIKKQEKGIDLSKKEKRKLRIAKIYLDNYTMIEKSNKKLLGNLADCKNLIPFYEKRLAKHKTDTTWLRNAAGWLSSKKCTGDQLFFTIVEKLNKLSPSAKTAYYLGQLAEKEGNISKALSYYKQSAKLEKDPLDKARVYYKLGSFYKGKGSYSTARNYFRKALDYQPSLGDAYLQIAEMYVNSVNNCGGSTFTKRAVYWLAADYAERAARLNPAIKKRANQAAESYRGRAPQKQDIFVSDFESGETIKIGCWINESVVVPAI